MIVVGFPLAVPNLELAGPKEFVETDSFVPSGLLFGLISTVIDVVNTRKLVNDGAVVSVLVDAVMIVVCVLASA